MQFLRLFLLLVFISGSLLSCRPKQPVVTGPHPEKEIYRIPYDTLKDDIVSVISGIIPGKNKCAGWVDSFPAWQKFAAKMDSGFTYLDTSRFVKMEKWADAEIDGRHDSTLLFYPFGGPDFLNANIFYPSASVYLLIGLEPPGMLPQVCNMQATGIVEYTADIWNSLSDLFLRSYFITGHMIDALKKSEVNGTLPVIAMFVKRRGYRIVSVNDVALDSAGVLQYADSMKNRKIFSHGVRIDFARDTGKFLQSVVYLKADISDKGLADNPPLNKYLSSIPACHTYLKAASYLMHGRDFSGIRNIILDKSISVLQDDSGIAYRFFDKNTWDIKLFGKYSRPGKEFSWINETDLAEAYRDTSINPVPFTLGYNWRTRAINLLYATKKKLQIPLYNYN